MNCVLSAFMWTRFQEDIPVSQDTSGPACHTIIPTVCLNRNTIKPLSSGFVQLRCNFGGGLFKWCLHILRSGHYWNTPPLNQRRPTSMTGNSSDRNWSPTTRYASRITWSAPAVKPICPLINRACVSLALLPSSVNWVMSGWGVGLCWDSL